MGAPGALAPRLLGVLGPGAAAALDANPWLLLRLPQVTAELLRRGWPEDDVRAVLGGNTLRLFRKELGVPGRP